VPNPNRPIRTITHHRTLFVPMVRLFLTLTHLGLWL
jgi:hypothetical protein